LHFNLAHSGELALLALTRAGEVGVDVERIRPMPDALELAARFFSPREVAALQTVPPDDANAAFFRLWTRKEAWLKATGEGIAESLARVEVTCRAEEACRVVAIGGDAAAAAEWSLHSLEPAAGCLGALAIRRRDVRLRCWTARLPFCA
jgi:4'-phosphopantetheinyl transferase